MIRTVIIRIEWDTLADAARVNESLPKGPQSYNLIGCQVRENVLDRLGYEYRELDGGAVVLVRCEQEKIGPLHGAVSRQFGGTIPQDSTVWAVWAGPDCDWSDLYFRLLVRENELDRHIEQLEERERKYRGVLAQCNFNMAEVLA